MNIHPVFSAVGTAAPRALGLVAIATPLALTTTLTTTGLLPAQAQRSCEALPVVEGQGVEVEKTVSPPSLVVYNNNWDTDFDASVVSAQRYVAAIEAEDGGEYSIEMYLKYPDDTADEIFNDIVGLDAGEKLRISGSRRLSDRPYQVNISVGGISAVGNSYDASVVGCA